MVPDLSQTLTAFGLISLGGVIFTRNKSSEEVGFALVLLGVVWWASTLIGTPWPFPDSLWTGVVKFITWFLGSLIALIVGLIVGDVIYALSRRLKRSDRSRGRS